MIAFIFAGVVVFATLVVALTIGLANSMSDAPTVRGTPVWPTFVIGFGIAVLLVGSHYIHIPW